MAARYGGPVATFIKDVKEEIYFLMAALMLQVLVADKGSQVSFEESGSRFFLQEMLRPGEKPEGLIEFSSRIKLPIVAVGAPAGAYFPPVAEKLRGALVLPEAFEVANAVGTVSGKVLERVVVVIKPGEGGGFLVHTPRERRSFIEYEEAVSWGEEKGRKYAHEQARFSGARDIEVILDRRDKFSGPLFIESILENTAVGRPWNQ